MWRTIERGLVVMTIAATGCGSNGNAADDTSCDREGATSPCAITVAYEPGDDSATCASGHRVCSGGQWSACDAHALSIESVGTSVAALTTAACANNPCDPWCKVTTESGSDVDGGTLLAKTEAGGVTLTANATDASYDGDARVCTGLQCQIDTCAGDPKKTVLTGTVYDPAGKNPVYNALVYVPNAAVDAIKEGVSCDSCATSSGSPIVSALTGPDGKFELKGVPSGKAIPLVLQVGKWRRQITADVTKCTTNTLENPSLVRLPRNRTEGSMPRIAFVSGNADPFQCLFSKMGIDASEVGIPVDTKSVLQPQRVHYYNSYSSRGDDLSKTYGGAAPSAKTLFGDATRLKNYDVVILSCEGGEYAKDATYQKNMVDYANVGGRVFATHFSYVWLQNADAASNWPAVVQTWNHTGSYSDPLTTYIETSFPKGAAFSQWLTNVGASTTAGQLVLNEPRRDYTYVDSTKATSWMRAWHDNGIATPTGTGGACFAASDCGAGTKCTDAGVCSTGASCSTTLACDATLNQVCSNSADCSGAHKSCSSAAGTAYCKYKSGTTYYTNKCASGYCANGKSCTADADCAANQTRSCAADSECKGGYKCVGYTTSKTNVCWYKSGSTLTSGVCDGMTCNQSSCTSDAACGAGNECSGGKCVEAHNMEPMFTFNTPVGASADKQCGRVVFSDFHVSADAVTVANGTSTYPENCKTGDLSAQEKALEFMLFDLSACITPDYEAPTAPPPAPPYLTQVSLTRDFTATCAKGERAVWRFFDWQTVTPSDSKITVTLQTGSDSASLAAMTPRAVATISGAPVTSWTGVDVATVLSASPPVPGGSTLRMNIKLAPSTDGKYAPTLTAWRQAFDCVAAE